MLQPTACARTIDFWLGYELLAWHEVWHFTLHHLLVEGTHGASICSVFSQYSQLRETLVVLLWLLDEPIFKMFLSSLYCLSTEKTIEFFEFKRSFVLRGWNYPLCQKSRTWLNVLFPFRPMFKTSLPSAISKLLILIPHTPHLLVFSPPSCCRYSLCQESLCYPWRVCASCLPCLCLFC